MAIYGCTPHCSESYINCLSIIYMYTQRCSTMKRRTLYSSVLCCVAGSVIIVRSCILAHSIKHVSTIEYLNHAVVRISQNGRTQANNIQANSSASIVLPIRCRLRVDFQGIFRRVSEYAVTKISSCVEHQTNI